MTKFEHDTYIILNLPEPFAEEIHRIRKKYDEGLTVFPAEITVAGVKLTSVTRAQITITPDDVVTVGLTLVPGAIAARMEAARVVIDGDTRDVLMALGWTAPDTAHVPEAEDE